MARTTPEALAEILHNQLNALVACPRIALDAEITRAKAVIALGATLNVTHGIILRTKEINAKYKLETVATDVEVLNTTELSGEVADTPQVLLQTTVDVSNAPINDATDYFVYE